MRLNSFEVNINVEVMQNAEQDGSRRWWWRNCSLQQFKNKFLHEFEHRPEGMSKSEFIWKRVVEYFEFEESDEYDRETLRRHLEFEAKYPDSKVHHDNSIYKANRIASLPDCRKDEALIDKFLDTLSQKDNNSYHFPTNFTNEIPQIFTIDFVFN